VHLYPFPNRF
jgi:hypothetical protein